MKTPEEIKKGLECAKNCEENDLGCRRCPYLGGDCSDLHPDALAYIQQLEVDSARQDAYILRLENELEAVKRERDAAVKDLTEGRDCYSCKHLGQRFAGPCVDCMSGHGYEENHYEWRGVCPENTEVQDGQV